MKIIWTPGARQDRADIWNYLYERNPDAADRIDCLFSEAVARLADYPLLGHPGEIPGTRELNPHRSYRLVYQIDDDSVWILTVIHAMRLWPPLL
ncbi:type II toxin-antitoxin system RelE/ParE family toxin [Sphingobium boeckii]|uniref:Addiction module RelE/StbE family toxin n=1 Tax=Sphingobium boeckii TaxID=1082345 RepID=A0A7W9AI06_9SPHN|nr:type II toxin-antitoxin system RelE/ParE family toxin [Sphingobium boeckii]MBB5685786.1 addiction module RelE/StbE family toxin [Sphingobium boeckii]